MLLKFQIHCLAILLVKECFATWLNDQKLFSKSQMFEKQFLIVWQEPCLKVHTGGGGGVCLLLLWVGGGGETKQTKKTKKKNIIF